MNESNFSNFVTAARQKLRFAYKGSSTVEDLWDLDVEALDSIYKALKAEQKESSGESLLHKPTPRDSTLELKVAIVKFIVETKIREEEEKQARAANRLKREKIKNIIAAKKDEELHSMSIEELEEAAGQIS
jgi:hypothetical protein